MKYFIHLPMKMEPIVSSESSAIRTQAPGNYPKRNNLFLEHGGSLRTRLFCNVSVCVFVGVLVICEPIFTVIRFIRFVTPVVFIIKPDWSACICLTQLYDGRDTCRIYYIMYYNSKYNNKVIRSMNPL